MTEWNWDDALAVRYEEGHDDGCEDEKLEIAMNALAEGLVPELVQKITGLDMDTIEGLRAGL